MMFFEIEKMDSGIKWALTNAPSKSENIVSFVIFEYKQVDNFSHYVKNEVESFNAEFDYFVNTMVEYGANKKTAIKRAHWALGTNTKIMEIATALKQNYELKQY